MKLFNLCLVFFLACSSGVDSTSVWSQEVYYDIDYVAGLDAMPIDNVTAAAVEMEEIWSKYFPFPLKQKSFNEITDFTPIQTMDCMKTPCAVSQVLGYGDRNGLFARNVVDLFIFPPVWYQDKPWVAGYAMGDAYLNDDSSSAAVVYCTLAGRLPEEIAQYVCTGVMLHELLHVVGADHLDGKNMMNGAGIPYMAAYPHELKVWQETIDQVQKYLNKKSNQLIMKARVKLVKARMSGDKEAELKMRAVLKYRAKHLWRYS